MTSVEEQIKEIIVSEVSSDYAHIIDVGDAPKEIVSLMEELGYRKVSERTPQTDLENELADKEFARQYRDSRIVANWEIKMVELGYRKVSELPLLSDEEIHKITGAVFDSTHEQVAKAQRDLDLKNMGVKTE